MEQILAILLLLLAVIGKILAILGLLFAVMGVLLAIRFCFVYFRPARYSRFSGSYLQLRLYSRSLKLPRANFPIQKQNSPNPAHAVR